MKKGAKMFNLRELFELISKFEYVQLCNSKNGQFLTNVTYKADNGAELWQYTDYKVYGISPQIAATGEPYLRVMLDLEN